MLNVPEEIRELFRADNINRPTEKKFKLSFYNDKVETLYPYETLFPDENLFPSEHGEAWLEIENDRIESESLTITESLSESEELQFGSCEATMMEIIVADVLENVIDREFTLTVEIGGYPMPLGIFTVTSFVRQADRRKRKITAYDRMRLFDTDVSQWYNELTFPTTIKRMRDSLCEYIGIPQVETELIFDSLEITKTIEPQEISGLDIMKSICELNGCFGHVNKFGEFSYIKLPLTGLYPSEDLFPDEDLYPSELGGDGEPFEHVSTYRSLLYEDYIVDPITSLSIREQEGDIGANVGDGENVYVVEGNFLVYGKSAIQLMEIAATLLPAISNRVYKPASLECNAMPWVEVGDSLRIITRDDIIDTFVMSRVTTGCQAMVDSIESSGSPRREEVFGINKQIIQLEGKSAVITKNVEEVSVRLTNLKEDTETAFAVMDGRITLEVTKLEDEDKKLYSKIEQTADRISLDVSNFKEDTNGRFELTDKKIELKVSKGSVSSELSVEPDKVELRSNRLIVDSTNFKLDGSGNATFSGKITGGSIRIDGTIPSPQVIYPYWFEVDENGLGWDSLYSSMTKNGKLSARDGKFSGTITASNIIGESTITGASITGGDINGTTIKISGSNFSFKVNSSGISLGDFEISDEYGRNTFQSKDGAVVGLSTGYTERGGLLFWAGWDNGYDHNDLEGVILVNQTQVHAVSEFYLHGPKNINVYDEIQKLWNAVGGGGGYDCDCDEEDDCYSCGGNTDNYSCSGDHTSCGPGAACGEAN